MRIFGYIFGEKDNSPSSKSSKRVCKDTDVVLDILYNKFHGNNEIGVCLGMDNERTIAADREVIAKYRAWLTSQPSNIVNAYEYWLKHFENGCDEAESAIRNHAREKQLEKWKQDDEKSKTKDSCIREVFKTFPKP